MTALAVVTLVWIGLSLGVSFLATPVKFLAPSLSLPVALDVGRQTFLWFNRVELLFASAALLSAFLAERHLFAGAGRAERPGRPAPAPAPATRVPVLTVSTALLFAAVAGQMLWLLPALDARVEIILQGGSPPPSALHDAYVVIEAVKLAALTGVAWAAVRGRRPAAGGSAADE